MTETEIKYIADLEAANLDMNAQIITLRAENKRLRDFIEEYEFGHEVYCDYLDDGSPRTDCTCGYEKDREQALKGSNNNDR